MREFKDPRTMTFSQWITHIWDEHVTRTGQSYALGPCPICRVMADDAHAKYGRYGDIALRDALRDLILKEQRGGWDE